MEVDVYRPIVQLMPYKAENNVQILYRIDCCVIFNFVIIILWFV